jgi:hypothetical protein
MVFEVCSPIHTQMLEPYIWGNHVGLVLPTGKKGDQKEMLAGSVGFSFYFLFYFPILFPWVDTG